MSVVTSLVLLFAVFDLKPCFPIVGTLGHELVSECTPKGRKESAPLGAKWCCAEALLG